MIHDPSKVDIQRPEQNYYWHRFVSKPDGLQNFTHPASTNGYPLPTSKKNVYDKPLPLPPPQRTAAPTYTFSRATTLIIDALTNNLRSRTRLRLRARTYCGQEFFSVQIYTGQLFPISNSHSHSYPIQFSLGFIYLPTHTHIHKHTHTQAAVSYNPTVTQLNLAMAIEDVQNCSALARALRVI